MSDAADPEGCCSHPSVEERPIDGMPPQRQWPYVNASRAQRACGPSRYFGIALLTYLGISFVCFYTQYSTRIRRTV